MLIIDLVILLVVAVLTLSGYRKGVIMSLCALLIFVVAGLGASAAQELLADRAAEWLEPQIETYLEEKMEQQVSDSTDAALEKASQAGITVAGRSVTVSDLVDMLKKFGLDVEESAETAVNSAAGPVIEKTSAYLAHALAVKNAGTLVFLMAFLLIYLVLEFVLLMVNVVDRLPVIRTLNHLGGGVVGFLSAVFLLAVSMAVLMQIGFLRAETLTGPLSGLLAKLIYAVL